MNYLCLDIMNSNRFDYLPGKPKRDFLKDEEWIKNLLSKWKLPANFPMPTNTLRKLQDMRLKMYNTMMREEKDITFINEILQIGYVKKELKQTVTGFEINDILSLDDWDKMVWYVAESFARLLCEVDLERIKFCENPDCGWIFMDETKNRSRQYCTNNICANLMKVRRYRNKHKK